MTQKLTARIPVLMTPSEVKVIDDWSFAHRVRSRGEAIRKLVERGLQAANASAPEAELSQANQARLQTYTELSDVVPISLPTDPDWNHLPDPTSEESLHVKIPARLKSQVDYLANRRGGKGKAALKTIAAAALAEYLSKFGIK